jgi:uncharacterized repeat protein (TIGR04076 family)
MYKVRCKLVKFEGDAQAFPCHFNYKIGDEIYYDGEQFTGRICTHIILSMMPVVYGIHVLGHNYSKNMMFRYRGMDMRDPDMTKYDGAGWRPRKHIPDEDFNKQTTVFPISSGTEKAKGSHFLCPDSRTIAHFTVEPIDLSDSDSCAPYYRRAIAVLEKIEPEPGIKTDEILGKFTEFEREEISPPLTPVLTEVLLEALSDMDYIIIKNGEAHSTGKEPPSRPKIG